MGETERRSCGACREGGFGRPLAMAFQPIVDIRMQQIFAFEALVRGPAGESAGSVIASVMPEQLYAFDQACRIAAIEQAAALGVEHVPALSINFMPNAVYEPRACIRATLDTADRVGFPPERLIFEITEAEAVRDPRHLTRIVEAYQAMGFRTALDDFGAGHSNLDLLAQFRPDIVKLDMVLVRGIDADARRQALVRACVGLCLELDIALVAEGVETAAEYSALAALGVRLQQGYWLAKPGFRSLPAPVYPEEPRRLVA